jgi:aminoglycoside phosphotransferase family enzyme
MSWVFLTDQHVYKLKKPVRSDYLDFSTPEARYWDCTEEVRLNRRFAPNVYHGVVPLTVDLQGALQLAGRGATIDWLVHMRRLPAERMLDYAIARGTVRAADIRQVGTLLTRAYLQTPAVAIAPATYRQWLVRDVQANRQELTRPLYALPAPLVEAVLTAQIAFLEQATALLDSRVRDGRIIEAHGDLRPEHICLEDEPVIIDCLEFNQALRILDTVSELAFLALECERLGAPAVGKGIVETYSKASGGWPSRRLLAFYKSYHAGMRAKIAVWHLNEPEVRDAAQWRQKAQHYLRLAARLTRLLGHG